MKISIGADHAGFELKEKLRLRLSAEGHDVTDRGTGSVASTDYPDYATTVARDVAGGNAERGILVCSTGVGMSITANKVPGVRAALGWNADEVRLTREHNDANVLAIGAKYTDAAQAVELVDVFLHAQFLGGRHQRRVEKIATLDATCVQKEGDSK
jgi:ribose 5-phosphate isomerase B